MGGSSEKTKANNEDRPKCWLTAAAVRRGNRKRQGGGVAEANKHLGAVIYLITSYTRTSDTGARRNNNR